MTTPAGTGAVDSTPTPTTGGGLDASGWAGAEFEDAPDARQGRQHVPGEAPTTVVLDGPARMTVGAKGKTRKSAPGTGTSTGTSTTSTSTTKK